MTSSNPLLRRASVMLEREGIKQKAPIWTTAARMLRRSAGTKVEINVGRISRMAEDGDALFVPGKVLGSGNLERKVSVGAFSFSNSARAKIAAKGGQALSIEQFIEAHRGGSGVKLVE